MKPAAITMRPCESSRIKEYGYDETTKTLAVRFQSKTGPGALYHYDDVPAELVAELEGAESKGRFVGDKIVRGHFKYLRIDESNPDEAAA